MKEFKITTLSSIPESIHDAFLAREDINDSNLDKIRGQGINTMSFTTCLKRIKQSL